MARLPVRQRPVPGVVRRVPTAARDSRYNFDSVQRQSPPISSTDIASKGPGDADVTFRAPDKCNGADIAQLVRDTGVLDVNSAYAYLLVGEHFGRTSVIAEIDGRLAGFISAYCLPDKPDTIFVWQVGVADAGRGRGIATRMLLQILRRSTCAHVSYLDTTISPSNTASMALFRGLARKLGTDVTETELFSASLFGDDGDHEPEILFRIGPFDQSAIPEDPQ